MWYTVCANKASEYDISCRYVRVWTNIRKKGALKLDVFTVWACSRNGPQSRLGACFQQKYHTKRHINQSHRVGLAANGGDPVTQAVDIIQVPMFILRMLTFCVLCLLKRWPIPGPERRPDRTAGFDRQSFCSPCALNTSSPKYSILLDLKHACGIRIPD